jgi:sugar phosphate isomerase/epimerase
MRFFEPGLCSVTFRSLSPQAVIELAAANGIRSIEWGADIHVPPGNLANARDVAARTAEAGLSVSSYGSYIFAPDFAPEDVTAVLETAKALGAGHIRIWPGSRKRPSADYSPGERRAATEALATVARRAHDYDITIGLEYHPNSLTDTLPSALQLMQDLPMPNLFFYWQPAPGLPLEDALTEISALGPRICHLHVFAWLADASRLPLIGGRAWMHCRKATGKNRLSRCSNSSRVTMPGGSQKMRRFSATFFMEHRTHPLTAH